MVDRLAGCVVELEVCGREMVDDCYGIRVSLGTEHEGEMEGREAGVILE